jgi:transketolase
VGRARQEAQIRRAQGYKLTNTAESESEPSAWVVEARTVADATRLLAAQVCAANAGGYLVQACGSAEILATLYTRLMDLGPSTGAMLPDRFDDVPRPGAGTLDGRTYNGDRDRFYVSPAHYALGVYATLVGVGRLDAAALSDTNADGSTLEMIGAEHSPGFETTSGSLGQALSVAVGQALVRKRFGRSGHVWALISDGETEEGQTWEALAAAVNFGLGNLTILLDANGLQVDGWVRDVMNIEPIVDKVRAFGCVTVEVDGHDPEAIASATEQGEPGRPLFVVCRTTPTQGVPSLKGRHQIHYVRFRDGEVEAMIADLRHTTPEPAGAHR